MAEAENPTISSTPASTAAPAAVTSAPTPTPSLEVSSTPSVALAAETPTAPAPKPETSFVGAEPAPEAEPKPEIKAEEKADVKAEEKPETKIEDKKVDGEKLAETKPAEGEVKTEVSEIALPTYEPFVLPEGLKVDEKATSEFAGLLGKLEAAKSDHKEFQEIGQKIVDLYTARLTEALKAQTDYFVQINQKQRTDWREELRKDPIIGKNDDGHFQASQRDMVNFLARNGGTKEEVRAFRQWANESGNGESPALVRVLSNLKTKVDLYEKEASQILPGTKPASSKPAHPGLGIMNSLYGGKRA